jgi:hypothetical protein
MFITFSVLMKNDNVLIAFVALSFLGFIIEICALFAESPWVDLEPAVVAKRVNMEQNPVKSLVEFGSLI